MNRLAELMEARRAIDAALIKDHGDDLAVLFTDIVGSTAYFEADRWNRAPFQGKASQHPRQKLLLCSDLRSAEPPETGSLRPSGAGPPGPEGFPLVNALVVNGGGVVQAAGNSSSVTNGAWARRLGSGSARKPRCSRIFFATSGSSMQAMSRILP